MLYIVKVCCKHTVLRIKEHEEIDSNGMGPFCRAGGCA